MNARPIFGSVSPLPPERVACERCRIVLTDETDIARDLCGPCWTLWPMIGTPPEPVALNGHDRWRSDACVLALAWDLLAYRLGPESGTLDMMHEIEASHGLADPLRRARDEAR